METFLYADLKTKEDNHFWHVTKRKLIVNLIKKSRLKSPKILDIGCGTGKNLEEFGKLGHAFGIDKSKKAISYCRLKGLKKARIGFAHKTGFKDSCFDIVTLLDVLEHVEEKPTIWEIKRILVKDGLLIISVPAYQWLWSGWDDILHHKRRYTQKSLKNVLESNGFKIVYISYVYSFLLLPAILIRTIKSLFYKNNYSSDFNLSNKPLNKLLIAIFNLERAFLGMYTPFGTSIVCVAKNEK